MGINAYSLRCGVLWRSGNTWTVSKIKMVSELRGVVHRLLLHHVIHDALFPIPYGLCRSTHWPSGEGEACGPCVVKTAIIAETLSMNFNRAQENSSLDTTEEGEGSPKEGYSKEGMDSSRRQGSRLSVFCCFREELLALSILLVEASVAHRSANFELLIPASLWGNPCRVLKNHSLSRLMPSVTRSPWGSCKEEMSQALWKDSYIWRASEGEEKMDIHHQKWHRPFSRRQDTAKCFAGPNRVWDRIRKVLWPQNCCSWEWHVQLTVLRCLNAQRMAVVAPGRNTPKEVHYLWGISLLPVVHGREFCSHM